MKNQIVILAAGKGTRMGNSRVPKVLTMLGKRPLILYVLGEISKINQLVKPVIVVGYGAEKVKGVLGDDYLYAYQDNQLGTAHALLSAKYKIKAENILVLYGDMPFVKAESLKGLISLHFKTGGRVSMLASEVKNFKGIYSSLENYGRIIRDPISHEIVKVIEFKDANEKQRDLREINPGIYMFNTEWLWPNLKKIQNQNIQKEYYLTDIVDVAIKQGEKVRSLMVDSKEILGINSKNDLDQAERILTS
jgi:bifunctional UDP-N-acetylglucosamine pyrophosphorylase / glucosamine-1-phosphate N-acetyltransferase